MQHPSQAPASTLQLAQQRQHQQHQHQHQHLWCINRQLRQLHSQRHTRPPRRLQQVPRRARLRQEVHQEVRLALRQEVRLALTSPGSCSTAQAWAALPQACRASAAVAAGSSSKVLRPGRLRRVTAGTWPSACLTVMTSADE